MNIPGRIILSRPDALGDAVVTLTTAGWIKHHAPGTHITVLCRNYARPVWACSSHVDDIITLDELQAAGDAVAVERLRSANADAVVHVFPHREVARWAKQAGIARRIGTSHRWWHWFSCNERVDFTRKNSALHEAQLNIKLLAPFGIPVPGSAEALIPCIGFVPSALNDDLRNMIQSGKRIVVLHPLSKGSAVEWGLPNFSALIHVLDPARWHVLVTGTKDEAERYRGSLPLDLPHVTDLGGKLKLDELIAVIGASDALVAASTGPLHIAAACGKRAIGLFGMRRPIHPGRWAPLGTDAHVLVHDTDCPRCARGEECDCIARIAPQRVLQMLER
ncbi:MAG: glycosyltransferase family 9 protein [Flavobacteriales bacterium]|nr:MAG: glycosyltransferase family 9 protein [Flavobacteriales bacterium]